MDRFYNNNQLIQPQLFEVALSSYNWLQLLDSSPVEFYSAAQIKPQSKPALILCGEVYERAADGWLSSNAKSTIYGYSQSQISDRAQADRVRLEATISECSYHFNLFGINDYGLSLGLAINRDEIQELKDEPKELKRGLLVKFIQLGIMLASLINPDYLPLLTSAMTDPNLEVILPQWQIAAASRRI